MRILLTIWLVVSSAAVSFSQQNTATKLYFYCFPDQNLYIGNDQYNPVKINRCTLLETTMDSLKLRLSPSKAINIPLQPGRTYYFMRIKVNPYAIEPTGILTSCTEEDFWLNTYFSGISIYRHYLLDRKSGLRLVSQEP